MIAPTKNKGIEKRPLAGTQDFLNKARLCRGAVCVSSNADGLFRVPGMWAKGKDVCDICAESEPVPLRFFSAKPSAQPKPKPTPAPKPPPPPPKPAKPDKAEVHALVAAELARVLPGLVRAEVRKVLANV